MALRLSVLLFLLFSATPAFAAAHWAVAPNSYDSSEPQDMWESPTVVCLALRVAADEVYASQFDHSKPDSEMPGKFSVPAGIRLELLGSAPTRCADGPLMPLEKVRVRDGRVPENGKVLYINLHNMVHL